MARGPTCSCARSWTGPRAPQSGQILFCNGMQATMGLKVTKARKPGGPAWEVRSAQPVSLHPHALSRTSAARPLPGGPSLSLRNVSSLLLCLPLLGVPEVPCTRRLSALSSLARSLSSFTHLSVLQSFQPLPTSSSWMHHHRAPLSPQLKWASRVIELENATNRRGSSLCHSGQFAPASAVLPRATMLLCRAVQCYRLHCSLVPALGAPGS